MDKIIPNPTVRKWMYGVGLAVVAVLIGYGIVTAEQGNLWISLITALLGFNGVLSVANTPTTHASGQEEEITDFVDEA